MYLIYYKEKLVTHSAGTSK